MKGHSKIELTDVNTGAVQTFENDNMVTNALKYYLADAGVMGCSPLAIDSNIRDKELWKALLGGIMLFGDTLEEDADNVLPKAGITMIGNGAYNVSNSGDVTELGSWNKQESGLQSDGSVKLVFDFSTAQANGAIKSCALSSAVGGYMGVGNTTSGKYISSKNENVASTISHFSGYSCYGYGIYHPVRKAGSRKGCGYYICYADLFDNSICYVDPDTLTYNSSYASSHFSSTGSIVIKKYGIPCNKINVKDSKYPSRLLEEHTITVPDEIITYLGSAKTSNYNTVLSCGKDIYIIFANSDIVATNASFYVLHIDKDFTATMHKMINTTGYKLSCCNNYVHGVTSDGFLLMTTYGDGYFNYKIKISDSTVVEYLNFKGTTSISNSFNDKFYNSNDSGYFSEIDTVLNKFIRCNTYGHTDDYGRLKCYAHCVGNPLFFIKKDRSSSDEYFSLVRFCGYLATINNLSTPVTKTASQTMKVTYTLTFD